MNTDTLPKQTTQLVTVESSDQPDRKGLQKFTLSVAEIVADLYQQYPLPGEDAPEKEKRNHKQLIVDKLLKHPDIKEKAKDDLRNQTWEDNHRTLLAFIDDGMQENGCMPSVNWLVYKSGLSRTTILKHLKGFHESTFYQHHIQQFKLITSSVLTQLYTLAMHGDVKAAKVYLDAVGGLPGLKPPTEPLKPAGNYIQINNNIKIDQPTFTMLPSPVQQQITELILQGMQSVVSQSLPIEPSLSDGPISNPV